MRLSTSRHPLTLVAAFALLVSGCGPTLYTARINKAESAFEEARAAGAANVDPYDFHYAEANLHKAREDAGEAAYQDAMRYARRARASAERALARTRAASHGTVR